MAETPEASDYTSIEQRIQETASTPDELAPIESPIEEKVKAPLMPFDATACLDWAIPFAYEDYVELVDWAGRVVHPNKRGKIPSGIPVILNRLGFDGEVFIRYAHRLLKEFATAIGKPASLAEHCAKREAKYLRGIRASRCLLAHAA